VKVSPVLVLLLATGAGIVSWTVGALVRAHASRLRLIDRPNARSSHTVPTPRGGGLGIVAASVCGILLLRPLGIALPVSESTALVAGGLFVAAVSFVDDLWSLHPLVRLAVHVLAAVFALQLVGGIVAVGFTAGGAVGLGMAGAAVTVLWIAGLTNAYNFMDGTDGLAGAQGVVAAGAWALVAWLAGRADLALVALLLCGSSAGFLLHNWSPARLFMGDVGSAFLGYTLAVMTVIAARQDAVAAMAGPLVLWPFIFDPVFTLARRARRGEHLMTAHRSHLYQRLVATGWTHQRVCSLYTLLALCGAGSAAAMVTSQWWAPAFALSVATGSVLLVAALVRRGETYGSAAASASTPPPAGRV
jgi:Fuc2NAc and GlcNAc transferase